MLERLRDLDLEIVLADPTLPVDRATAAELGADLLPLDELMAASDVVSLHAPVLPSTVGMIGPPRQLSVMKDGATFINTARGVLVDHDALRAESSPAASTRCSMSPIPNRCRSTTRCSTSPTSSGRPSYIWPLMGTELVRMSTLILGEVERFDRRATLAVRDQREEPSRIA